MDNYEIYTPDLREEYIMSLNASETETLLREAQEAELALEYQLDHLFWRDNSRYDEDGNLLYLEPSMYTYELAAFEDEIAADPDFKVVLLQAQDLQSKIARTGAIVGAATLRKQEIINANYTPDRQFGDPLDAAKFDFEQMGYKLLEPELREEEW